MPTYTPEQITEILDAYFNARTDREYIGMRYVPIFGRKGESSIEWDGGAGIYEPLTVVLHERNSYTSRQYVPVGVDISNTDYWAQTGNYDAQVEALQDDVNTLNDVIGALTEDSWNYEIGTIADKAIYSIFTFPKEIFKLDLTLTKPNQSLVPGNQIEEGSSIYDYVHTHLPIFACNVAPNQDIIYNDILYGSDWTGSADGTSGVFGVDSIGEPHIQRGGNFSDIMNVAKNAIGSTQPLIINGNIESISSSNVMFLQPHPRQIFAWDDFNYYLFSAYGRMNNLGGLTFEECQNFAITKNWPNVMTFDGGASIQNWSGKPIECLSPNLSSSYSWRIEYMTLTFEKR